jgi:hypothetical protein
VSFHSAMGICQLYAKKAGRPKAAGLQTIPRVRASYLVMTTW